MIFLRRKRPNSMGVKTFFTILWKHVGNKFMHGILAIYKYDYRWLEEKFTSTLLLQQLLYEQKFNVKLVKMLIFDKQKSPQFSKVSILSKSNTWNQISLSKSTIIHWFKCPVFQWIVLTINWCLDNVRGKNFTIKVSIMVLSLSLQFRTYLFSIIRSSGPVYSKILSVCV